MSPTIARLARNLSDFNVFIANLHPSTPSGAFSVPPPLSKWSGSTVGELATGQELSDSFLKSGQALVVYCAVTALLFACHKCLKMGSNDGYLKVRDACVIE